MESTPGESFQGFEVPVSGFLDNIRREFRGRGLFRPVEAVEVISQELFVETRLRAAGFVGIHGPESRRVRRQELINQNEAVINDPEFKLCVRYDDPFLGSQIAAELIDLETQISHQRRFPNPRSRWPFEKKCFRRECPFRPW